MNSWGFEFAGQVKQAAFPIIGGVVRPGFGLRDPKEPIIFVVDDTKSGCYNLVRFKTSNRRVAKMGLSQSPNSDSNSLGGISL